jgi:hypothetical protein
LLTFNFIKKGLFMKKLLFFLAVYAFIPTLVRASDAGDYYTAGLHYYQQGQTDQAIQYCQNAIQADPNFWQAYQVLGYCYYAKKNNAQAILALDKSLEINPNNPQLQQFDNQLHAATPAASAAPASTTSAAPENTASNATPASTPAFTIAPSANRNLPKAGSFNLEGTLAYVYPGYQDLTNFYGNAYFTGIEDAVELNLGGAYSFTPNIQVDALLEFGGKAPVDVANYSTGDNDEWDEYYFGGAAGLNILIPISDGTNFVLHGEGGFYALVGSSITYSGFDQGTINLDASAPGYAVAAGLEFLMNQQKTWALEIELGYRYLHFSPVTGNGEIDGTPVSGTLINADSSNASIDFSGPRLSAGVRL